ncbi:6-carboxyhexanoate--CoA ligase [Domibacillus sp. 8LH]|uniref:6-carboxyhexanoate--CoA ligase n=1 Tax=Domibacillus sp. 8LH TaxID=3073900 RepID=UPI00317DA202
MQENKYYSVRMRASKNQSHEKGGQHLSGGEQLVTYSDIKQAVDALLAKSLSHSRGKPDFMQIQFERVDGLVQHLNPLPVTTNTVHSTEQGQQLARQLLEKAGIPPQTIQKAYQLLMKYSGLSGAMLVDIHSGKRLDEPNQKGIRVSRMDWPEENFKKWTLFSQMAPSARVKEAMTLAVKVSGHPAAVAELCWSDDPDYVTGYVAGKQIGYQRITNLKEYGDERGCRIFFVNGLEDITDYIRYLKTQPVLVQWEEHNDI